SFDRTVKLWDARTGQERTTLKGHTSYVFDVNFSPDGQTLASGSIYWRWWGAWHGEIKLWDVQSGQERATLKGYAGDVYSVVFSPDGQTLASAGGYPGPGVITLWDVRSGQERVSFKGHKA